MEITELNSQETIPLRHKILRPHQTEKDCIYPGDDDSHSFHLGMVVDKKIIAVSSFFHQTQGEHFNDRNQWRLRGLATELPFRGQGIASKLLQHSLNKLSDQCSPGLLWCNARVSAATFYQKLDFKEIGDEFDIQGIGPHYVYWIKF